MIKLYSHGQDSDLRTHLLEVMSAAQTLEEKVLCACHDLGKATKAWQDYILEPGAGSPHHHAAAGGIYAALVLLELNRPDAQVTALAALHAGAAHHTFLQQLGTDFLGDLSNVVTDPQAREFVLDPESGIASLLPEIASPVLLAAWERFVRLAPPTSPERRLFNEQLQKALTPELRLAAYLCCRSWLGRLCLLDHSSAARQSGKAEPLIKWQEAFPDVLFRPRSPKQFAGKDSPVTRLRRQLQQEFLRAAAEPGIFYFIDAPTGLGKTEAMLQAAEAILSREKLSRIVFAVPQVSVADQIFEEYFNDAEAQIWNYRRREKSLKNNSDGDESLRGNGTDAAALEAEQHPFAMSYNVTTFNQVLLAMCHPDRNRCIRSLGLRDAVVILDEFHKLPQVILPFFFRIARQYAQRSGCKFILGSATPLEPFQFWELQDSCRIPAAVTMPVYQAPEIDNRRHYRKIGNLSAAELAERIQERGQCSSENLLVVVNLVGSGSWPLRQLLDIQYHPWQQLKALQKPGTDRIVVWLDGLVPPMLRRELVTACREAMRHRPVTLISTQMVEVGVDLDFDAALIDYQGLAATIQRGGRVGRNGRGEPCPVEVFSLTLDDNTSSFEQLLSVREKNDVRVKSNLFQSLFELEKRFVDREKKFFRKWGDALLRDSDLAAELSRIQHQIFENLGAEQFFEQFFAISTISLQTLGAAFEQAQLIAELYDSEDIDPIVLVESQEVYDDLVLLSGKVNRQLSSPEERQRLLRLAADRTITPSRKVWKGLDPQLSVLGRIDYPQEMIVYSLDSSMDMKSAD